MMMGTGFAKHMTETTKSNRALLKGGGGTYGSFDHQSYGMPQTRKEATYKEASPEVLAEIREQMAIQNAKTNKIKRNIILWAIAGAMVCLAVIFFMKF